ncbi:MAG: ribonuclease PH [Neisseriaceae bacterium]
MEARRGKRGNNEMRVIKITPDYLMHPEGSVLIEVGLTKVICAVTVEEKVPPFLKGKNSGWITAEYSMLPRSTETRTRREAAVGKQTGRTQEIQRLIGRALRQAVNLEFIAGLQFIVDCDVIQADGGTRTASITGAYVALHLAVLKLLKEKVLTRNPLLEAIAALSVGVVKGQLLVDLDYIEDSECDSDINLVIAESKKIIEIQGTAEKSGFEGRCLLELMEKAASNIELLFQTQKEAIKCSKLFDCID